MIFDFHSHPTFKPFNSKSIYHPKNKPPPDKELWKERFRPKGDTHPLPIKFEKEVNFTSQLHLNSLAEGGVRGICVSIYPLERVFTVTLKNFKKSFVFKILNLIPGLAELLLKLGKKPLSKAFFKMVATLTGYDWEIVREVNQGNFNYYNKLKGERKFLLDNQNKQPSHGLISYEIANNYDEYKRILNEGKLAFILSVEGSNSFLDKSTNFQTHIDNENAGNTTAIKNIYKTNLTDFKKFSHPPFLITFAHHQYNLLCGHAPSFVGLALMVLDQEGTTKDDQGNKVSYFELGIKKLGMEMIKLILNRNVGRRVLIDTKHLSAQARLQYHEYVKQQWAAQDHIPIIQTHTGISGRPKIADAKGKNLELKPKDQRKSEFFTISINLFDDEIVDIVEYDGLIGIMLDEKRIMGKQLPAHTKILAKELEARQSAKQNVQDRFNLPENRFKHNKNHFKRDLSKLVKYRGELEIEKMKAKPNPNEIRRLKGLINMYGGRVSYRRFKLMDCFLSIFMNQILYIIKTVENSNRNNLKGGKAWEHVCIGTDYEGVINPLDIFYYASDLQGLETRLASFWHKAIYLSNQSQKYKSFSIYRDYLFGKTPEYYIKKILWDNSQEFLKKYFTEDYLKKGMNP